MPAFSLYPKLNITAEDYLHYNTYYVEHSSDKVNESAIPTRLKWLHEMYEKKHELLSDAAIVTLNNTVKKHLKRDRYLLLIFGLGCLIAFYFALQYLKPTIGISLYYKVPAVYNNPWDFILVSVIFIIAWWYEKRQYKKKLILGIKNKFIAAIESHFASTVFKKEAHQNKKLKKATKNRRW
ncbi:hypothetical protein [Cellulophaga sp. E6(2014)]|uniref:hypothetical protein n=1 Tax=Cellulophaga sp. E6(2014) TaxID=1495334 RepID=UPI00051CD025|nr:hypothetical protein [Cellulophaga sp. E6(2014)]KGK28685.1 hypothetical protein EL45_19460 [Cellulophaga sp. E6(2014)]